MVDAVLSLTRTLANPGDSFYVLLTGMVNINVAVTNSMNVDDLAKVRVGASAIAAATDFLNSTQHMHFRCQHRPTWLSTLLLW